MQLLENFLNPAEADQLLYELYDRVDWRQDSLRLFGRTHQLPRLHQWYGEPDTMYRWSGITMRPQPWLDELNVLRKNLEAVIHCSFNSVLANLYRDGNDSMGWHADDEPELGEQPVIASVSLGADRDFLLRYRNRAAGIANVKIRLTHGSLLVMAGSTQANWQHSVPKRRKINRPRLNMTFRNIYSESSCQ